MGKKIVILSGAARKNGSTAELVNAFSEGAISAGHHVQEFYLQGMNIHGCLGCQKASKDPQNPCVQKDDMAQIYEAFFDCDVIVFASPIYFWTITGTLKTAVDRLYAEYECLGNNGFNKESVLLMTAGGMDYSLPILWYKGFELMGFKDVGQVLGSGKTIEAKRIGASL